MLTIYPQSLFIGLLLGLYLALLMHLYRAGYRLGLLMSKFESGRIDEGLFHELYGEELDRSKLIEWGILLVRKLGRGRSVEEYIERAQKALREKGTGVEKESFGVKDSHEDGSEKGQLFA